MKLNTGKNIITDTDITMTDAKNIGRSLSEVINKLENDIERLNSNVKWIYKYGGVGSGAGLGGGPSSGTPWNYKVEVDNKLYKDQEIANFGILKVYKLGLRLYKVLGRTFNIKITYDTLNGPNIILRTIPPTAKAELEEFIDLQINGDITIAINDDEGNLSTYVLHYIVTAYLFELNYMLQDGTIYKPRNKNIFVTVIKDDGMFINLKSVISTDIDKESSYYVYTDWNNKVSEPIPLETGTHNIPLPLGKEITNENSGNYTFKVEIHLLLKGKTEPEIIPPLILSDNLIPKDIYLKIESDGIIYDNKEIKDPYSFYMGVVSFKITPFLGYLDTDTTYTLEVKLDGKFIDIGIDRLLDQITRTVSILTDKDNAWNEITFIINRKGLTFTKTYYFFTKSPAGDFNWYPTLTIQGMEHRIFPIKSYQYKHTINIDPTDIIFPLKNDLTGHSVNNGLISRNINDTNEISFSGTFENNEIETYGDKDMLIAIGLKYNKLNDPKKDLIRITGKQGSITNKDIIIKQNEITFFGKTSRIYFPKDDNWHLLTIYKRAVASKNGLPIFEYNVYLDGILETTSMNFTEDLEIFKRIILSPGLYSINYMEISYFKHDPIEQNPKNKKSICELYNPNPNRYIIDYMNDLAIVFHFYTYKLLLVEPESVSKEFRDAYSYALKFYYNYKTDRVECTALDIKDVASHINVPVLIMEYTEVPRADDKNWVSTGEAIFDWMEKGYKIETESQILKTTYPIEVYWSKGLEDTSKINIGYNNVGFLMALQGTSTLNYRNKNFDLLLKASKSGSDSEINSDDLYTYLFSPNYKPGDYETFLPEKRFTLKADIVDSSHSNNNSLGKFINTVTTKFRGAELANSKYSSYIKNTLEGFPILLFFKNRYTPKYGVLKVEEDYYYLGIYNFNLGRDSEYNLGYKDLRYLPENLPTGFNVIAIDHNTKVDELVFNPSAYVPGFGVAEILENHPWFDFSLNDRSILFPLNDTDSGNMLGKIKPENNIVFLDKLVEIVGEVGKASGHIFEELQKNMLGKDELGGYKDSIGYKNPIAKNLVPNFRLRLKRQIKDSKDIFTCESEYRERIDNTQITKVLLGLGEEGSSERTYPLIDYTALSEYYVCCMALGLVDSVMKNLNIKTWNNNTFYPSFYDMDTALGKDNAGRDTNYMAFSDYWDARDLNLGSSKKLLLPAFSYKDWSPPTTVYLGYDLPTTYLLALAKYGYHILKDNKLKDWYPNNIWARFRRRHPKQGESATIPGWIDMPDNCNTKHIGCLENADTFINNFFKKHLETVPDTFFNLNYRKKYFVVASEMLDEEELVTGFNSEDISKFSGRRIYSVHDWLNGRFHILDLYFNLALVEDSIYKYNLNSELPNEDDKWEAITNANYTNPDSLFIDSGNKDIIVLQDIFLTGTSGIKYSYDIDVEFTSELYSPLSLRGAVKQRSITKQTEKPYVLQLPTGGKSESLGGSYNWDTLKSINSLVQTNDENGSIDTIFYVNSDKLTNLTGDSGACNNWQINLPALRTISLTSNLYGGNLEFNSSKNNVPNLNTINISNSHIGLNLDGLNVTLIIADHTTSVGDLKILNCHKLLRISFEKSRFNSIDISPRNSIVYYFSDNIYTASQDGKTYIKGAGNQGKAYCKNLTLTRPNKLSDGAVFIDNLQYNINNLKEGLLKISLTGYKDIFIDKCSFLKEVDITDPLNVETLIVTNSGGSTFSLGSSDSPKLIDLSKFTKLKKFSFYGTGGFDKVILPKNTKLEPECLAFTSLKYLEEFGKEPEETRANNTGIMLCKSAFHNSGYTLLDGPNGNMTTFNKLELNTPKDLSMLFHSTNIKLDQFKEFNTRYSEVLKTVENAEHMWAHVGSLSYNYKELLEDYIEDPTGETCRIDLSVYKGVTNASYMIGGYSSTALHPAMFKGLGENKSSVNINNFIGQSTSSNRELYITLDWLRFIKNRVSNINCPNGNRYNKTIVVKYKHTEELEVKDELELISTFKVSELFPSGLQITSFENWTFDNKHTIDFGNLPFSSRNYPRLTKILYSFCNCSAINLQDSDGKGFMHDIPGSLTELAGSFGFNNASSLSVNLNKLFHWSTLKGKNLNLFQYSKDWDETYNVMGFNKTLLGIEQFNIIINILIKDYKGTSLSHVFSNCSVDTDADNSLIKFGYLEGEVLESNKYITDISYLFNNLLFTGRIKYIDWDWNMMSYFPNVTKLIRTFRRMKFNNGIPFDVFKRRKERVRTGFKVLIEENGKTKYYPATVYTYYYEDYRRISTLKDCFRECGFNEHFFKYTKEWYDKAPKNRAEYVNDNKETKYTFKYIDDHIPVYLQNPEFDDITNRIISYNKSVDNRLVINLDKDESDTSKYTYDNFPVIDSENLNNSFIPPEFLYACTDGCDLSGCFCNADLLGFIPDHLFKYCRNPNLKDFIKNVLIFPLYYGLRFDKDQKNRYNIYYYLGHDFVDSLELDLAFNFRIALSGLRTEKTENVEGLAKTHITRDLYIFSFRDSFNKNISSALNMTPNTIASLSKNLYFIILNQASNVLLNMMYNNETEEKIPNTEKIKPGTEEKDPITGEIIKGTGLKIPNSNDLYIGDLGLDLSHYNRLMSDKLFNSLFILFTFGRLLDKYSNLNTLSLRSINASNQAIEIGNSSRGEFKIGELIYDAFKGNQFGISGNILLPDAFSSNIGVLSIYCSIWDPNKLQVVAERSQYVKKSNFDSGLDSALLSSYYNGSRNRPISYGIVILG